MITSSFSKRHRSLGQWTSIYRGGGREDKSISARSSSTTHSQLAFIVLVVAQRVRQALHVVHVALALLALNLQKRLRTLRANQAGGAPASQNSPRQPTFYPQALRDKAVGGMACARRQNLVVEHGVDGCALAVGRSANKDHLEREEGVGGGEGGETPFVISLLSPTFMA